MKRCELCPLTYRGPGRRVLAAGAFRIACPLCASCGAEASVCGECAGRVRATELRRRLTALLRVSRALSGRRRSDIVRGPAVAIAILRFSRWSDAKAETR
jgi:hypothetical protein